MNTEKFERGNPDYDLLRAIVNGDLDRIKESLGRGADVNYCNPDDADESVLNAVFNSHNHLSLEAVDYLIESGFDTNADHILTHACFYSCDNLVQRLIERGADINRITEYESPSETYQINQPIMAAAYSVCYSVYPTTDNRILRMLIDAGVQANYSEILCLCVGEHKSSSIDETNFLKLLDLGADLETVEGFMEGGFLNERQRFLIQNWERGQVANAAVEAVGVVTLVRSARAI